MKGALEVVNLINIHTSHISHVLLQTAVSHTYTHTNSGKHTFNPCLDVGQKVGSRWVWGCFFFFFLHANNTRRSHRHTRHTCTRDHTWMKHLVSSLISKITRFGDGSSHYGTVGIQLHSPRPRRLLSWFFSSFLFFFPHISLNFTPSLLLKSSPLVLCLPQ